MLIENDRDLRSLIPNVMMTVEGEETFFEKLRPYLVEAEEWLSNYLVGAEILQDIKREGWGKLQIWCRREVALHAFANGVPNLDLMLTPNGFAVAGNDKIVPASRDRVDRLASSLCSARRDLCQKILDAVRVVLPWKNSKPFRYYSSSFFSDFDFPQELSTQKDPFRDLEQVRQRASKYEAQLAVEVLSNEYSSRLMDLAATGTLSGASAVLVDRIRVALSSAIIDGRLSHYLKRMVLDLLLSKPEDFPEWLSTAQANSFQELFQNDKLSSGYYF